MNALTPGGVLDAVGTTLLVFVLAGVGSIILGTLVTVARVSPIPLLRAAAFAFVQFFLNVPLLALLIIAVFALPDAGVIGPLLPTAIITLAVYEAAYVAEAVRSGVNTIAVGQLEAARALGLTQAQTLSLVVIPQALRAVVQPIANVMIALVMNTALLAAVGIVEITAATNVLNQQLAQPIPIYTGSGLVYMIIALAVGLAAGWVERKVAIKR
ncbi:MAG TPA: amino acid ABC transporter permease [Trebonia sp.]|nr:amino acid ABC transporter permease [Trebonia sp.]